MTSPAVSVIVTNFNYSRYLTRCLKSCIEQCTNFAFEVLVVDDGSTDNSVEVARQFVASGVRLIQMRNEGIEAASNAGISSAGAELVVRVDADDYLLPAYLETVVPGMTADSSFAYSDYIVVDGDDRVLYEEHLPPFNGAEILTRGDFLATGTVYRKAAIRELGGYDESTKNCGLENYELILKLLKAGHSGHHIAQPLFAYRRHGLNVSEARTEAIIQYGRRLFEGLDLGPYATNAFHPYKLVLDND